MNTQQGGMIQGGISGASTGAMVGGPWGAAIGGAVGLGLGALSGQGSFQEDNATQNLSNLSRSQWEQAAAFLNPIQSRLISYAENKNYIPQQREQAYADVNTAYNNASSGTARTLSGMGVDITPEQEAAMAKQTALQKGLTTTSAGTQATRQGYATQMGVLTGG